MGVLDGRNSQTQLRRHRGVNVARGTHAYLYRLERLRLIQRQLQAANRIALILFSLLTQALRVQ